MANPAVVVVVFDGQMHIQIISSLTFFPFAIETKIIIVIIRPVLIKILQILTLKQRKIFKRI